MLGINITLKHAHITLLDPFLENGCWKESKYCQLTGLDLRIHVKVWWLLKGVKHDAKLEKYKMLSFVF